MLLESSSRQQKSIQISNENITLGYWIAPRDTEIIIKTQNFQ